MSLTLYRNGSVYSAADPFATAMLVDGDVVAWVGSEHAAASLLDSRMQEVDLGGALVAPGFVDSHVHVTETGLALDSLDLAAVHGAQELLERVSVAAADDVTAGVSAGVLLGHGWDNSLWADPRLPGAAELERAAGGREVYLARVDVHSGLVSASLAERCSLASLPGWDGDGLLSGVAHATARDAARALNPEQLRAAQRRALRHAAANGYVALAEMGAPHVGSPADLAALMALTAGAQGQEGGQANAQANASAEALPEVLPYWGQLVSSAQEAREVLDGLGVGVLGLAGDINIDGSLGSRSALLRKPYADAPTGAGTAQLSVEQVANHFAATSELGLSGGFHVIGDGAMDIAVAGLEQAERKVGIEAIRAAGHRLEHAEMVDDAAMAALAKYAVGVSVQPAFDALWGGPGGMYSQRLGSARALELNPLARFYGAGVPVCFGSDAPVTPLNPWSSVRAALNHHHPESRISARAAFIGHTRAGWRAAKSENPFLGQLVPGAPASFAVWEVEELMVQVADERVQSWSTDPRARTPLLPALDTANDPRCLQTVHRGRELYVGENFAQLRRRP
ncbi:amidohydrolase family protein [Arthrobacter sp. H35-D1]|uniref:amidohydrolase n=1 Tax=Arthrobacter sp. H35-D1 TaxID=3046202 RepID=UPI0024B947C2|nr:amidohydrolase family protein [Arthrobacter sp. H35-D1]MDJ0314739.1 amidohydrolase family protein [Arthrobacter sp. H35-D1]